METIKSSDSEYPKKLMRAAISREKVVWEDDAGFGIQFDGKTLFAIFKELGFTAREYLALAFCGNLSLQGVRLTKKGLEIAHPPTKLGVVLAGATMTLAGFGGAFYVLTGVTAGSVKVGPKTFEVKFAGSKT